MSKQLFFEMDFGTKAGGRAAVPSQRSQKRRYAVRRAVLRWLEETDSPTGMGAGVTTRIHRFRADVAAFWSVPRRNAASEGPDRILEPVRTAIVQCYAERDQCWPDCVRSAEALDRLGALLGPGGVLIYETFMLGNAAFGKPSNPDFLLMPGELLERARDGFTVIAFEQGEIARPAPAMVQRICARKGDAPGRLPD